MAMYAWIVSLVIMCVVTSVQADEIPVITVMTGYLYLYNETKCMDNNAAIVDAGDGSSCVEFVVQSSEANFEHFTLQEKGTTNQLVLATAGNTLNTDSGTELKFSDGSNFVTVSSFNPTILLIHSPLIILMTDEIADFPQDCLARSGMFVEESCSTADDQFIFVQTCSNIENCAECYSIAAEPMTFYFELACTACNDGMGPADDKSTCQACSDSIPNCISCSSTSFCTACNGGKVPSIEGDACEDCPEGEVANEEGTECFSCPEVTNGDGDTSVEGETSIEGETTIEGETCTCEQETATCDDSAGQGLLHCPVVVLLGILAGIISSLF